MATQDSRLDRLRDAFRRLVGIRKLLPFLFFIVGALVLVIGIYFTSWPRLFAFVSLILAGVFVLFLAWCRPGQKVAMSSIGPALFGPALTSMYLSVRPSPLNDLLAESLVDSTDALIQLTFFFAALIGFIVQLSVTIAEKDDEAPTHLKRFLFFAFVSIVGFLVFSPDITAVSSAPGPLLAWGISAPPLSHLTICRVILGLCSVGTAIARE